MLDRLLFRSPLVFAALVVAATLSAVTGCSSKAEGDVACDGGVCTPKPVFASGILTTVLVTADAVYAAERTSCGLYVADKPLKTARRIVDHACSVSAMARTDGALFWVTTPTPTSAEENPKGMLAVVADDDPMPVVIDATLEGVRGLAVLGGDTVYVAVADGIRKLAPGSKVLERVVDVSAMGGYAPQTLRAFGGSLYWHDGFMSIYGWRPGDPAPAELVKSADLKRRSERTFSEDPFAVDESGIYWISSDFFGAGGELRHAPLAGGIAGTMIKPKGFANGLALDAGFVYWSEGDQFIVTENTVLHRTPKADLGTSKPIGTLVGAVSSLSVAADGLYIGAEPSLTDFDAEKGGFQRYGGPLLVLPRAVLDTL